MSEVHTNFEIANTGLFMGASCKLYLLWPWRFGSEMPFYLDFLSVANDNSNFFCMKMIMRN